MSDDTSRETTGNEIQDPLSALAVAATATHEMFRSYVEAGFTEQQALFLTAQVLTASMRGQQGRGGSLVAPSEHLCPRRGESPINFPGPDRWESGHGLDGQDEVGLSCSHCGSLNPDRFMGLVRAGWSVGPTDKNYKAYLNEPVSNERRAQRKAAWEAGDFGRFIRQHVLDEGGTEAEGQAKVDEYWQRDEDPYLTGKLTAKFYFQHLSAEQRHEFIELHNSKTMAIGYPGRFYVWPFFCGSARVDEESVDG